MKNKISHLLLSVVLGISLLAIADTASARCWVTNGYWHHGYWNAGHRVCNGEGYRNCGWVGGYRDRFGFWHRGHRAC